MERAADAVRAEMLTVVNAHDLLTTPEPSRAFAELAGACLLETGDDCGHQTMLRECEGEKIASAIRQFLEGNREAAFAAASYGGDRGRPCGPGPNGRSGAPGERR